MNVLCLGVVNHVAVHVAAVFMPGAEGRGTAALVGHTLVVMCVVSTRAWRVTVLNSVNRTMRKVAMHGVRLAAAAQVVAGGSAVGTSARGAAESDGVDAAVHEVAAHGRLLAVLADIINGIVVELARAWQLALLLSLVHVGARDLATLEGGFGPALADVMCSVRRVVAGARSSLLGIVIAKTFHSGSGGGAGADLSQTLGDLLGHRVLVNLIGAGAGSKIQLASRRGHLCVLRCKLFVYRRKGWGRTET